MIAGKFPIAILIVAALAGVSCEAADRKQIQQLLETKSCEGCDLSEADLHGQNLFEAKLAGANLRDADLRDATLTSADLSGARLAGAKLEGAKLIEAKLNAIKDKDGKSQGVGLEYAHLKGVNLNGAEMKGALLLATELKDARLFHVDLEDAIFEPASLPDIESISDAANLKKMTYDQRPAALLKLRKAFKEAGFQNQQRQITYALMRKKRLDSGPIENSVRYVLFELTSEWGLSSLRPLWLMILLIFPFALLYAGAILRPHASAGLWRVWDKDRIRQDIGTATPVLLKKSTGNIVGDALYFSFLSAFSVGWHEINIGTWIGRLNPDEYTLRATGWLRSLSGFQSLVSIFLLALAFLCYFGDPFE
jgi:uncharacterized protein YjbI with pentapeptide repeats